jgi:hypothetical protein
MSSSRPPISVRSATLRAKVSLDLGPLMIEGSAGRAGRERPGRAGARTGRAGASGQGIVFRITAWCVRPSTNVLAAREAEGDLPEADGLDRYYRFYDTILT